MMSSCIFASLATRQRDAPIPTLKLPPILMQVEDPSILTNPGPYSAQGLTAAFGRSGSDARGLPCFGSRICSADAKAADNAISIKAVKKRCRIGAFYRGAGALATAPKGVEARRLAHPGKRHYTFAPPRA